MVIAPREQKDQVELETPWGRAWLYWSQKLKLSVSRNGRVILVSLWSAHSGESNLWSWPPKSRRTKLRITWSWDEHGVLWGIFSNVFTLNFVPTLSISQLDSSALMGLRPHIRLAWMCWSQWHQDHLAVSVNRKFEFLGPIKSSSSAQGPLLDLILLLPRSYNHLFDSSELDEQNETKIAW